MPFSFWALTIRNDDSPNIKRSIYFFINLILQMKCLYVIMISLKGMESFFIKRRRAVKGDEINFLR
jgi:hypothetical protein